ncbi:MAG: nucleotide exchange factor GrpE [Planctomycetales bacterium]|nr:nucleotide exchange factor GrpE [Planctomycetales bacterium]
MAREDRDQEGFDATVGDDAPENVAAAIDESDLGEAAGPSDAQAELAAASDRILRLQAEVQNQISRSARQLAEERRYAALPLSRDLLPVLDNVDRAIEAAEKEGQSGALLDGIKLVRQQLMTVLKQHQCEPIEAEGQPFNPDFHEAILQQPSDQVESGHVLQQVQPGYKMHDRVVRASQVIVSSGPAAGSQQ